MGVALGYSVLAYQSLGVGLHKLEINHEALWADLFFEGVKGNLPMRRLNLPKWLGGKFQVYPGHRLAFDKLPRCTKGYAHIAKHSGVSEVTLPTTNG